MSEVRLQIYGEPGVISVNALIAALQGTMGILKEVDRACRQGEAARGHWLVGQVWNGSIGVELVPSSSIPQEVPERLLTGINVLEERPELPPWFSELAIGKVQKMGKILHDPSVFGIGLKTRAPSGEVLEANITSEVIKHAGEAFQGKDSALGSVAGVLDVVNLRRGKRTASLYDADEHHAVHCTFPAELFEMVREHLGSKVRATGTVNRNRLGQVASVNVEFLDRIEEGGLVPTVAELAGIAPWFTGNKTAVEYQRWTRSA